MSDFIGGIEGDGAVRMGFDSFGGLDFLFTPLIRSE